MRRSFRSLRKPGVLASGVGAVAALAAACAGPDYRGYLDRWVGAPEAALVADWGAPDWRNPFDDGSAELHYIYEEAVVEIIGSPDGDRFVHRCLTTFRVAPGTGGPVVRSWRYAGNFCVPPREG